MKKVLILFFVSLFMIESRAAVYPGKTAQPVPGRKEAFLALEQFFKSYDTAILRRLKRPVAVMEEDYNSADPEEGIFSDVRSRVLFKDGAFHTVRNVRFVFFVTKNYLEIRNKTGV